MEQSTRRSPWAGIMVVLFPSIVVVLFNLLRLSLRTPTAGGLAFLAAILIAYRLFPRTRVTITRLALGVGLGAVVALLMAFFFTRSL